MYADLIRLARPTVEDAVLISAVERATLADSPYTATRLAAILERPEHRAYLAVKDGAAVGFCSCFLSCLEAAPQLEIDMLGVLAEHRGRGVAASLVRHAVREARRTGAATARAVVAEGNVPSLAAFRRAGLTSQGEPRAMLVCISAGLPPVACLPPAWRETTRADPRVAVSSGAPAVAGVLPFTRQLWNEDGVCVAQGQALPVQTLSYRGLWVERLEADSSAWLAILARGFVELAKWESMDKVGYLAASWRHAGGREALAAEGFQAVGYYSVLRLSPL
jgi:ribosomal protein S18 acetylase RimI-like enzyme